MSATTQQGVHTTPGTPAAGDFADWLSPMIVKELRQGLRTRTFTGLFMLIQVVMVILTFVSLSAIEVQSAVRGFFWFTLVLAVVALIPLKGLQAINSEASDNTLDLLVLTRLQALRIVAGKWAALVAQAFLAVIAVLPYVFIHYFFGGVNLLHEVFNLMLLLFVSGVLSAITVCFSAGRGKLARKGFAVFGFLLVGYMLFQGLAIMMMSMGGGRAPAMMLFDIRALLRALPFVLTYGSFLIYLFLEIGAGRLAPEACNHSTRRRLVSLGVVVVLLGLILCGVSPTEVWARLLAVTALIIVIDAFTDLPSTMRSLLLPFHLRRMVPVSYLLAPGWHTGALFSLLFLGAFALVLPEFGANRNSQLAFFFAVSSIVVMPAALVATFFRRRGKPFRDYLLVHVVSLCVASVLGLLSGVTNEEGYIVLGCILTPHATPFLEDVLSSSENFWVSLAGGWHLALAYFLLLWSSRSLFAEMRRTNREIVDQRREPSAGQTLPGAEQ